MTTVISKDTVLAINGGTPAAQIQWPTWPVWDSAEREGLLDTLDSGKWWYGEKVREFEERYAAFHHVKFGISCTNGTTAIEMGLRALGVGPGDEVIVPPYSFVATASAVITVGAMPVFADIEPDTLCIDPEDVLRKITARTRAIVPVHVGGLFADMPALTAMARAHDLKILEDAAHAWGSLFEGKGPGTLGDAATFSFQGSKNITAGEGGIVLTNDASVAELCRSFSNCGRSSGSAWYEHEMLGSNLRINEFQAAILLAQLSRLEAQTLHRERSAKILEKRLANLPGIRLLKGRRGMTRRSYHMFIFRIDPNELGIRRERFMEALTAEGVPCSAGWVHPLYANGLFQSCNVGPFHPVRAPLFGKGIDYTKVHCPTCEQVCSNAVWIPHAALLAEPAKIERLADAIVKVSMNAKELR